MDPSGLTSEISIVPVADEPSTLQCTSPLFFTWPIAPPGNVVGQLSSRETVHWSLDAVAPPVHAATPDGAPAGAGYTITTGEMAGQVPPGCSANDSS